MEHWKKKHAERKTSHFLTPTTNAIGRLPNTALCPPPLTSDRCTAGGAAEDKRVPALAASSGTGSTSGRSMTLPHGARLQARVASQDLSIC